MYHSKAYGAMNKRRRKELGLGGHKREEIWRMMAEQEARINARLIAGIMQQAPAPRWARLAGQLFCWVQRLGQLICQLLQLICRRCAWWRRGT